MKFILPVVHQLSLDSGFTFRNPKYKNLGIDFTLKVDLWNEFELIGSRNLHFEGKNSLTAYLSDVFLKEEVLRSTMACVEILAAGLSHDEVYRRLLPFEGEVRLRSLNSKCEAGVLYDLFKDKPAGHKYSPILHSGHASYVKQDIDSIQLFVDYRVHPTSQKFQTMYIQLKNPEGNTLKTIEDKIPFNNTRIYSFRDLFAEEYQSGCRIDFKGGESQFGIFNIFINKKNNSFGIEHSLPPYYYFSDIYKTPNRVIFMKNAFSDIQGVNL
jgi:hypothetical protein